MSIVSSISNKLYYAKKNWWKNNRLIFPSPAEVRFVQIFGGRAVVIKSITHFKTGFPLTFIVSMGRTLRRELIRREVRAGAMYIDFAFANDYMKRAIEIDGDEWHLDVLKEQARDEYLRNRGWKILHIKARDIYRRPDFVKKRVINFLAR